MTTRTSKPQRPAKAASAPRPSSTDVASASNGKDSKLNKKMVAGLAFGIGSAAVVAALLYANSKPADGDDQT